MKRRALHYLNPNNRERWLDRICYFLLGVIIFGLVVGLVVSRGRAQSASSPGITGPVLTAPGSTPATAPGADNDDIRDIHGPVSIPYPWLWMVYVAAALGGAALLYALWQWYQKRKVARAKQPHELALEALDHARALLRPDSARDYSFAVSEVVRRYIEARFQIQAANRTTEEFLHDLVNQSQSPLAAHAPLLELFLKDCDLVKFGQYPLSLQEMEAMHESAKEFILATRPQPEMQNEVKPGLQTRLA
jgi:Domain of unknown function (DUF4381)